MSVPPRAVAAAVFLLCAVPLSATERLERRFDARDGLPVAEVSALTQDSAGFIWIGTYGGLLRYDGAEMRLWGHETLNNEVRFIVAGADREVIVGDGRRLFRVTATGLEIVSDAIGSPVTDVTEAAFDGAGRLWIVRRQQELLRYEGRSWQRVETIEVVVGLPGRQSFGTKKPEVSHTAWVGGTTADAVTGNNTAILVTKVVGP